MSLTAYPVDSLRRNILIGVVFIKDDIRKEAKEGIKLINSAGVQTVMITGDSLSTAVSIAKEVGIITSDNDIYLESSKLEKMTDDEIKKILPNLKAIARALPDEKD